MKLFLIATTALLLLACFSEFACSTSTSSLSTRSETKLFETSVVPLYIAIIAPPDVMFQTPFNITLQGMNQNSGNSINTDFNGQITLGYQAASHNPISIWKNNAWDRLSATVDLVNGKATVLAIAEVNYISSAYLESDIGGRVSRKTITIHNYPNHSKFNVIDGSFKSGNSTTFSITLFRGNTEVRPFTEMVTVTTVPLIKGFPMETLPVLGVATFSNVFITEPKAVKLQVLLPEKTLSTFDVNVGDNVKVGVEMFSSEIVPGGSFNVSTILFDSWDNLLIDTNGKSTLTLTFNGNHNIRVVSQMDNGRCLFSNLTISSIYSSPVYVKVSYQTGNQVFESLTFELKVNNLTVIEPIVSIKPQKSIPSPQKSNLPQPRVSLSYPKPFQSTTKKPSTSNPTNPTNPTNPVGARSQRLNSSQSIRNYAILFIVIISSLITMSTI